MFIAKVKGTATSTAKNSCFEGFKLLLVEIISLDGEPTGREYLAVDTMDAGIGDKVLLCMEGGSVGIIMEHNKASCDAAIVGVIDLIHIDKELLNE